MGINENESYLDNLLKAVMEPQSAAEPEVEYVSEEIEEPEVEFVPEEEIEEPEVEFEPEEVAEESEMTFEEELDSALAIEFVEENVQESDGDYMEMPEFSMDEDTAKEVQALLNMEFEDNSDADLVETEESEVEFVPEEVAEEPEVEFEPEEVAEESEMTFEEELDATSEIEFVEESVQESDVDYMEMPEFSMDEDTAKEVQALLDMDIEESSDDGSEEIIEDLENVFEAEEIMEEPQIEYEPEESIDLTEFADFSDMVDSMPENEEISDDLLDEDIENLLGMESIETDDSKLEDLETDFTAEFNNEVEMIIPTVEENQFLASPSLEEAQAMSQEDIESLLNASAEVSLDDLFGGKSTDEAASEDDLLALLSGGAEDVASADDLLALLGDADDSEELAYIDLENDNTAEENEKEKEKKDKKSKKKQKKDKKAQDNGAEAEIKEKSEKKPGAFKRFMDFLMEEDEDEDKAGTQGEMEISEDQMSDLLRNVSDENKQIINELDKEEKKKKKRKKKGKKEEAEPVDSDEDEIEAKPTGKKAKQKKPKKEKKVKLEEYDPTAKKLSKKKVGITLGLIATIMVAILLVNYLYAGAQVLQKARNAYYAQDYAACYETLYGKELNESDEILFNRSSLMLRMTRSIEAYEGFMAAEMPIQALDSLIQGIGRFEALRVEAALYELEQEAEKIYGQLVDCLGGFGLTEQKALDIYNSESDEEYTNQLIDAVENGVPLVKEEEETEKEYLYDALPVEEEIN